MTPPQDPLRAALSVALDRLSAYVAGDEMDDADLDEDREFIREARLLPAATEPPPRTYTQAEHDESERQLRDCFDRLAARGEPDATLRGIGYSDEEIRTGKLTRFGPDEGSAQSESAVCVAGTTPRQAATEPAPEHIHPGPNCALCVGHYVAEPVPGDGG